MAKLVYIGCKLPHGIIIERPGVPDAKITLKGAKDAVPRSKVIILAPTDYGVTPVPDDFAELWFAANADFDPVKSGAIFMAKTEADLAAMADEMVKEKTGFEGMPTSAKELKKLGFKDLTTADKRE